MITLHLLRPAFVMAAAVVLGVPEFLALRRARAQQGSSPGAEGEPAA